MDLRPSQVLVLVREGAEVVQASLYNGVPTRKYLVEALEELLRLAKSLPE